jgi:hypothetical protein
VGAFWQLGPVRVWPVVNRVGSGGSDTQMTRTLRRAYGVVCLSFGKLLQSRKGNERGLTSFWWELRGRWTDHQLSLATNKVST